MISFGGNTYGTVRASRDDRPLTGRQFTSDRSDLTKIIPINQKAIFLVILHHKVRSKSVCYQSESITSLIHDINLRIWDSIQLRHPLYE